MGNRQYGGGHPVQRGRKSGKRSTQIGGLFRGSVSIGQGEIAEDFRPRRRNGGMAFSYTMLLPVSDLNLGDAEFNPYWIKATLEMTLTKQGTMMRATSDELVLEIRDGWLPKWNYDYSRKPPEGHVTDFHLAPNGPNKFRYFTVLFRILEKVGKAAQSKWKGKLDIPW
jgi:hypothetical protein